MNKIAVIFLMIFVFIYRGSVPGQDSSVVKEKHISLKGYIKDLQMVADHPFDEGYLYANQLHNRLIFSWFPGTVFTSRLEARNRIFTGSLISDVPGLREVLDEDAGVVDLSYATDIGDHSIACFQLDRAWVGIRKGKWDFTIGRQRINWGMNTVWNPNDVFNAYNFFDFDYEERQGSDAVRLQYTTGDFSFVEAAVSKGRDGDDVTGAMLYRFNTSGYDIQVLGGYARERPVGGIGWAGNISEAGFKAEATWFGETKDQKTDDQVIVSTGIDYSFNPGWYVNLAYLYNSGYIVPGSVGGFTSTLAGADPFPYENAILLQFMKEISPIWNMGLITIYSSDDNLVLMPSLLWSLATNWEVLLYVQYFQPLEQGEVNSLNGFLRLKWSFATR